MQVILLDMHDLMKYERTSTSRAACVCRGLRRGRATSSAPLICAAAEAEAELETEVEME